MVWLARQDESTSSRVSAEARPARRHKAAAIARGTGIPPAFAARVLAQLHHHNLLDARTGQHGGYVLARPAGEISLLEVIEAAEGPLVTKECVLRDMRCSPNNPCILHGAWSAAQLALRSVLAQTPVAGPGAPAPAIAPADGSQ
jgi:Rrf2 family protein